MGIYRFTERIEAKQWFTGMHVLKEFEHESIDYRPSFERNRVEKCVFCMQFQLAVIRVFDVWRDASQCICTFSLDGLLAVWNKAAMRVMHIAHVDKY